MGLNLDFTSGQTPLKEEEIVGLKFSQLTQKLNLMNSNKKISRKLYYGRLVQK